jgi:transposase
VHVVTDGLGNPLSFVLSSGNRHDVKFAQELLEPFDLRGKFILADRGYDSQELVDWIEQRGGVVIIPSRITNKVQREIDWDEYNERHLVENLFLKLKHNRRFSTRYEKKAVFFQAVTFIACILVWLF